jgi:hypothetical protein
VADLAMYVGKMVKKSIALVNIFFVVILLAMTREAISKYHHFVLFIKTKTMMYINKRHALNLPPGFLFGI